MYMYHDRTVLDMRMRDRRIKTQKNLTTNEH